MVRRTSVVLVISFLFVLPVQAERVYRSVDEYGNVTYESRPTYDGESIEERDISGGYDPAEEAIALDRAIQYYPVTLYVIANCPPCDRIRDLLSKRKIPFAEKDPTSDKLLYKELKDLSGGSAVPVVMVGDNVVKQITDESINAALDGAGYPKPQPENTEQVDEEGQPPADDNS